MNLYRIPNFHSAAITMNLQLEWCHLPLLQRLQQMLPHLVLIEQAVSRLFSICKHCGKGNCKKTAVGSRGDCRQQGGPGIAVKFGPGGPIILPWTVRGDRFWGGTVHGVTELLEWTIGLNYWTHPNCHKIPFKCRTKAKRAHSACYFANVDSLAGQGVFPSVSRGQRSRAYLISFNNWFKPSHTWYRNTIFILYVSTKAGVWCLH